uniref:Uncharacterized protein n=1 Tax=Glossina pallidipes TaxID=7398 RepID=A0A1A9ZYG7_GLOPL
MRVKISANAIQGLAVRSYFRVTPSIRGTAEPLPSAFSWIEAIIQRCALVISQAINTIFNNCCTIAGAILGRSVRTTVPFVRFWIVVFHCRILITTDHIDLSCSPFLLVVVYLKHQDRRDCNLDSIVLHASSRAKARSREKLKNIFSKLS